MNGFKFLLASGSGREEDKKAKKHDFAKCEDRPGCQQEKLSKLTKPHRLLINHATNDPHTVFLCILGSAHSLRHA